MADDESGGGIPNPFKDVNLLEGIDPIDPIGGFTIPPEPRETEILEEQIDDQNELITELVNELNQNTQQVHQLSTVMRSFAVWSRALTIVLVALSVILAVLTGLLVAAELGAL